MSNNTSNIAIKVENLGKRYFVRHEKKEFYETFQDVLMNGGRKIVASLNSFDRRTAAEDEAIKKFKQNHISKPFNPTIANLFYKAGFVESWGKGANNMVDDCIKMNLLSKLKKEKITKSWWQKVWVLGGSQC